MTRNEIREKIEGFGIYFDPDHPDHISRDKIETLEPPFLEWGTQKRSLRADGIDYVLWERLSIYLYTDTNEDVETHTADGRRFEDALAEAFDRFNATKNYDDELGLYFTEYTMEV